MDFDSFITFILFIVFFVLPSIVRQIQARKQKKAKPKKTKKPGVLTKIGEQIQKFIRELEKQAQQQREAAKSQENVWDKLADEEVLFEGEVQDETEFEEEVLPATQPFTEPAAEPAGIRMPDQIITGKEGVIEQKSSYSNRLIFRQDPLQNAVILSEILGKPAGLKG